MKIVILGSAYPLRGGGITTFNERLAREFQQQGFDTTIYSFSLQYPKILFPGKSQYSSEPAPADLNIKSVVNSINPFNWIRVGNNLRKLRPDILVVRYWLPFMGPSLGTILRKVKKNGHTKIICIADNILPHEKRFGDKPFTKYFIKPVDAFITMSEKVMKDLRSFTTTKPAALLPHPLYDNFGDKIEKKEARQKLGISLDDKVMLFFGFIRKYKGLDILLDAVKLLKEEGRNYKLMIAGEFYDNKEIYDEQIDRLGIKDQLILFTDYITNSDVKYYFCASDLVVQPYKNATQSGVTPVAYHFEIPMVVTNVGGLPDMVPDNKVGLVSTPDAASLAKKINYYFENGEEKYLPYLKEEKKRFAWSVMVDKILELAK
jgi:glycosyltransferase involved in cell wall biosynthesis